MTSTLPARTLAEYTDAEHLTFYGKATAGDEWYRVLEAEMIRRDEAARAAAAKPAAPDAQRAEWERMAHAQWLDAERVTRGNLLNARGIAEHIDPWSLWSGRGPRGELYAG